MQLTRVLAGLTATIAVVAACGTEGGGGAPTEAITPAAVEELPAAPDRAGADRASAPAEAVAPAAASPEAAPADLATPEVQELGQPVVWPAADVVFATPEEAAADFVREVLISDGDPSLGEFRAGDARSGEIDVFSPGETDDAVPSLRGMLLMRQLGAADGWFVIAGTSEGANIATPTAGSEVAAGPLTIEGEARGFEGTVNVIAFPPGDDDAPLDSDLTAGGALADLEPYSATVDLSGASPGDVVAILVHGDTGLGSDPSWFAVIPVVVADDVVVGTIPETR